MVRYVSLGQDLNVFWERIKVQSECYCESDHRLKSRTLLPPGVGPAGPVALYRERTVSTTAVFEFHKNKLFKQFDISRALLF